MSFITRWFRKAPPEDFEQALAALSRDIQKRQTRLNEIRLRERRSTLLFSVYALLLWVAYTALWYTGLLPNFIQYRSGVKRTAEAVPALLGPIVILFIRRIVQIWYKRIGDAEEGILVKLRTQQREKVEEVKKKTNYYSMRNLIERYDDGAGPDVPGTPGLRRRLPNGASQPASPQVPPQTPQHNQHLAVQTPGQAPMTPGLQQQLSPSPQRPPQIPLPPPRKQWFDKLADAILGDDDVSTPGGSTRYALICQKCFTHNGLVKESMWEDAQYVCPKCGYFNPSARALKEIRQGRQSASPQGRSPGAPLQPSSSPNGGHMPQAARQPSHDREEPTQMDVDQDS